MVFTGKVLSVRSVPPGALDPDGQTAGDGGWIYRLKVYRVYRGKIGRTIEAYTDIGSDSYQLDKGKSYLLFAFSGTVEKTVAEIFACSLSDELPKARSTIRQIEAILQAKPGSGGHIGGGFTDDTTDLSGIHITATAKGSGQTYEAVTAKDGSWDMRVSAGTYDLQAKSPHWYISPDDHDSLYPFKNIVIRDGQCADVEFSGMHLMN